MSRRYRATTSRFHELSKSIYFTIDSGSYNTPRTRMLDSSRAQQRCARRFNTASHLVWSWEHEQGGANTSVFKKWDSGGALRVRSAWVNRVHARDYDLVKSNPVGFLFTGLSAEGSACLYNTDGGVRAATYFSSGAVDKSTKPSCPPPNSN